jgi:hypothetical protein
MGRYIAGFSGEARQLARIPGPDGPFSPPRLGRSDQGELNSNILLFDGQNAVGGKNGPRIGYFWAVESDPRPRGFGSRKTSKCSLLDLRGVE